MKQRKDSKETKERKDRKVETENTSIGNEDQDWGKQREEEMSKAKLRKTHETKKR